MALVNGQETNFIPIDDRGLQYGDGVFETIRIIDGEISLWEPHMDRLKLGCRRLGISFNDYALLHSEAKRIAIQAGSQGVLKIILTRGHGGRGYAVPIETNTTRILSLYSRPHYPIHYLSDGIRARVCQQRLACNPALAGIKHLNRLEQVLARQEWKDASIHEGLMLDDKDHVIEGTMSNLFVISKHDIMTPALNDTGIPGIMRQQIIFTVKDMQMMVKEVDLTVQDLFNADELFISNSIIGIWPISKLEKRTYPVGFYTKKIISKLTDSGIL